MTENNNNNEKDIKNEVVDHFKDKDDEINLLKQKIQEKDSKLNEVMEYLKTNNEMKLLQQYGVNVYDYEKIKKICDNEITAEKLEKIKLEEYEKQNKINSIKFFNSPIIEERKKEDELWKEELDKIKKNKKGNIR
jgi:hypothetical protein